MAKTIQIEYTNPVTGAQVTKQVSVDVERYRRDTEQGAVESFFLKATASGCSPILENIDDLVADLLDGRPSHGRYGVVQSLIDTAFTADETMLSVTPAANTAGFVPDVPCVVMDKYGSEVGWFIPSLVEADFTIPTGEAAGLDVDAEVGWIVQQGKHFLSSLGENSQPGIKAQSERPRAPTGVTGSGTVIGGIDVSWTKPADAVITHYDIYCIKAPVQPTIIEPNSLPSVADLAAFESSEDVNFGEYFDEAIMELVALDGDDYFVGVVAKDGEGMVDVNESAIGWSAKITIA